MDFQRLRAELKLQYYTMVIVLGVVFAVLLISGVWGDVDHYWVNINEVLVDHKMPYSEAKFEYPPLALIVFAIPRFLSWDLMSFRVVYAFLTAGVYIVTMFYANKIAEHFNISSWFVCITITLTLISLHILNLARYDIYPTALVVMALWYYIDKKYNLAFALIAVGTMIKLFPALIMFSLLYPFVAHRDWKHFIQGIVICAIICVLSELPFLLYDFDSAFAYLSYHSDRGIQIESVVASFVTFINYFQPGTAEMVFSYGSDNLTGALPDAISKYMNIVMAASLVATLGLMLYAALIKRMTEDQIIKSAIISVPLLIVVFVTFNKVYSAQYGIWIIPLLSLVIFNSNNELFNKKYMKIVLIFIITTMAASLSYGLTYWLYNEYNLLSFAPALEIIKNIMTVYLMIVLLSLFCKTTGILSEKGSAEPKVSD